MAPLVQTTSTRKVARRAQAVQQTCRLLTAVAGHSQIGRDSTKGLEVARTRIIVCLVVWTLRRDQTTD